MPDSPDDTNQPSDAADDMFERRLRALVADAGADAPQPPDFRQVVTSKHRSIDGGRSSDGRRLTVGLGAGTLAIAAALALFFVLPRQSDDTLVVSDTGTISTPDSAVDSAAVTAQTAPQPLPTVSVVTTDVVPDTIEPTTTTASPSSATTTPPTVVPPINPTPIVAVDVPGQTVFGVRIFDAVDVDSVAGEVSARLGAPTLDSDWQSMEGQFDCTGSTNYRVLWWGDFRMTFERYQGDGVVRDELSAWTVGEPTLFGLVPIGDVPAPAPSNIVTLEGIGLGATRAEVEAAWANVYDGGDGRLVVVDRGGGLAIMLDGDGQVVGFGDGPFDCPSDEPR